MWNIILLVLVIYVVYLCIRVYITSNCSTCIYKDRCWNKSDDKYCKLYKCQHYKRNY